MSDVFIHIQTGGRKETFLRGVAKDMREATVIETVRAMLAHPAEHNLSGRKPKTTFRRGGHNKKSLPVLTGDEDVIPGVDAVVGRALSCA
jgi:hypothetical protein